MADLGDWLALVSVGLFGIALGVIVGGLLWPVGL